MKSSAHIEIVSYHMADHFHSSIRIKNAFIFVLKIMSSLEKGKEANYSAFTDLHQATQIRSFDFKDLKSFLNCYAKEIRFIRISFSSVF